MDMKAKQEEYDRLYRVLDGNEAFDARPNRNRAINQLLKRLEQLRAELAKAR